MQKFTIFTIIFSTIILTIVAELVLQDYLQKVYPPASSLQASVTTQDDFKFFYPDTEKVEEPEEDPEANTILEILNETRENTEDNKDSEDIEETESKDEVKEDDPGINETDDPGENTEEEPTKPHPSLSTETSVRVKTLLPALDIEGVKYTAGTPDTKIWDFVETEDLSIKTTILGYFEVEDIIGSFYELETKNPLISEAIYEELKTRFTASPEININETNDFGQASYLVNHNVKVNEVFLVIRRDNFVYCFGYQKQYHEMFKNFFAVLL